MKRLAIVGASGHGKVVADIADCCGWSSIIFYDDSMELIGTYQERWLVKGNVKCLLGELTNYDGVIIAIGNNRVRASIFTKLVDLGVNLITLIHPGAIVSAQSSVGLGTVIMPGAVINAFARVGNNVIINTNSSIDHDCEINDSAHVSPGASLGGNVKVGEESWVGLGSSIKNGIAIGSNSIVGAGAVVLRDVGSNITVVGNPAKAIYR